jgi:ABC-type multidrug transport system ATPase subunit
VLSEVERLSDRVIVIAAGEIRADGTVAELASRSRASTPYEVEVKGGPAPDQVSGALRSIAGVQSVDPLTGPPAGWIALRVTGRAGAPDLREPIAELARSSGWLVRSLSRRTPSLEEVFLEVLEGGGPPGGAP